MRISFLLHNAYAVGGTVRTTFTIAGVLARRGHQVEIVSVFRSRRRPVLALPGGVSLLALVDRRSESTDTADPEGRQPGVSFPKGDSRAFQYHRLAEERVRSWLEAAVSDMVVSTRTGLNVMLARFGPIGALRVGQEHLTHDSHPHGLRREMQRWYGGLDALVTMTEADAEHHMRGLRLPDTRVLAIPNSVPEPALQPADGSAKIVIAAGRLARVKRFPMLVDAFGDAAADCPGWSLRIYGSGEERGTIAERIRLRGLHNRVFLMGAAAPLEAEWVKGSIAAVTSAQESFGMTIAEAMRCGLPVVSTNCPLGPREIIRDGVDGRLVPRDSPHAFSRALRELMQDEERRTVMGRAAREGAAQRFDSEHVADRYESLLTELSERTGNRQQAAHATRRGKAKVGVATTLILVSGVSRRVRRVLAGMA